MQLFCKRVGADLMVLAAHDDADNTPATAYGADVIVLPYAGDLAVVALVGRPAPAIDLRAYAAARRHAVEIGGITVAGVAIATDLTSQSRIANAYAWLQASGAASIQFKAASGWIQLGADQIKAIALAVGGHVQTCFATEDTVDAGIAAGTIASLAQVDAAFASAA